MFSQGYVGVSKQPERRWNYHKNYGENTHLRNAINKYTWDGLIKEVVLEADTDYCLDIEAKLRPSDKIGWNIVKGGGKPPITLWNKGRKIPVDELEKIRAKGFGFKKGHKTWNANIKYDENMKARIFNLAVYMKDKPNHFAGKPMPRHIVEAARKANLGKKQSEESIKKRSLANKGQKLKLIVCPKCDTIGGVSSMKRWHFDNCTGAKLFKARTTVNGKRLYLGQFATKEQVDMAIKNAKLGVQNV
jgi:hypothetical protein